MKTGKLILYPKNDSNYTEYVIKNKLLGIEPLYSFCVDCDTPFPRTKDGKSRCNGFIIDKCPWCEPGSEPWKNGRGI